MFDFVRNSKIVKWIIVAICVSFFTFGLSSFGTLSQDYLVKVGNTEISTGNVLQLLTSRMQPSSKENQEEALEELVNNAFLIEGAKQLKADISLEQIKQIIMSDRQFYNKEGKFDPSLYQSVLRQYNLKEPQYIEYIKNGFYPNQINFMLSNYNIFSDEQINTYKYLLSVVYNIQLSLLDLNHYTHQIDISESVLKAYFEKNKPRYELSDAIKFESLVVNPELLAKNEQISEEQIVQEYEKLKNQGIAKLAYYIYIPKPQDFETINYLKIKKELISLTEKIKEHPEWFEVYAQLFSQDLESASLGGYLGWIFEKNQSSLKPFQYLALAQSEGVSDLIETEDGFYIYKIVAKINGNTLAEDRSSIEKSVRINLSKTKLSSISDKLEEITFHSLDNLKLASDQLKLPIFTYHGWISKKDSLLVMPNELLDVLFSHESRENKQNSSLIILGNSSWIVRVTDSRVKQIPNFEKVRQEVKNDYLKEKSYEIALLDAERIVAKLDKGEEVGQTWQEVVNIDFNMAKKYFPGDNFQKFLKAISKNNKASFFVLNGTDSISIVRVNAVSSSLNNKDVEKSSVLTSLNQVVYQGNLVNYVDYLSSMIKIKKGRATLSEF